LKVEDLVKAYVTSSSIDLPMGRATRALVRMNYDVYPTGQHNYIQNLFALSGDLETTPLLGARILRLLADVPQDEHEGQLIQVDQVMAYFSGAGVEPRATSIWLDAMLKTGLCLSYDPSILDIEATTQIEISPSGRLHLNWVTGGNTEYLGAMADVTPVLNEETYHMLEEAFRTNRWREKVVAFIDYVLDEDSKYFLLPDHESYDSQRRLTNNLVGIQRRLAEWISPGTDTAAGQPESARVPPRKADRMPTQLGNKAGPNHEAPNTNQGFPPRRTRTGRQPIEGQQNIFDFLSPATEASPETPQPKPGR